MRRRAVFRAQEQDAEPEQPAAFLDMPAFLDQVTDRPQLNGQRCRVLHLDIASGKVAVTVDDTEHAFEPIFVRPARLVASQEQCKRRQQADEQARRPQLDAMRRLESAKLLAESEMVLRSVSPYSAAKRRSEEPGSLPPPDLGDEPAPRSAMPAKDAPPTTRRALSPWRQASAAHLVA